MAKSLNKATLIGNVGKEPEVKYTGTGKAVASFSIATSESWKDKASGNMTEKTEWHNIVAWERLAEIIGQYVHKGDKLYIEGRIQNRSYDDKDGNKRYISEIIATDMLMLSGPREGGGGQREGGGNAPSSGGNSGGFSRPAPQPAQPDYGPEPSGHDDLPF